MLNKKITSIAALMIITSGCASYSPAVSPVTFDSSMSGPVAGVGIEGHDVISMTDEMIRDLLSVPAFGGSAVPPRIIMDGTEFVNRGSQRMDKDILANRMRVYLNRSAAGRMLFVGRHYQQSVDHERQLKAQGSVDSATIGRSATTAGADYKLGGTIQTISSRSPQTGMVQQYNLITFEMFDLDQGYVVWSNAYEISRASADDVIYR